MAKIKLKNLNKFKVDLKKFEGLTEEKHKDLLTKVAFQLLGLIVEKNPVATGRSQNNWQVAVDESAGTATIDATGAVTGGFPPGAMAALGKIEAFSTIILYNNVEYIVALEEGSSGQAPAGMVAVSIEEVNAQFP